ncbi:MAG: insulinase family protein, partial [Bacteroidales bacterium]|nr:insulinase family protein [Bacteroidales bacterium]
MKQILFIFVLIALSITATAQGFMPTPLDPDTRIGRLDNGLTYYIRHNEKPENQACFYIAQKVGSMQEEENQRGLAHFLEHMAFNGSEHFPGKRLIEMLKENGVSFGRELNAYTSFDETVYNIDNVPTNKNSWLIDSCLMILSDWSGALTLADSEIDNERGVIHSEWRMRTGAWYRMMERSIETLFPGSKYGRRMPIGLMDIVDNFPYQDLKDYYKTWYHPDHQAIIVVGDIDVAQIESKIKQYFSHFTNPAGAPPLVDYPVPDNNEAIYVSEKDKEQTRNTISINFKSDVWPDSLKNTVQYFASQEIQDLINNMAESRFAELVQSPDAPFTTADAYYYNYIVAKTKNAFAFEGVAKTGKEYETIKSLFREAMRIKKYGFTPGEFARAKMEELSRGEKLYTNRNKQTNSYYVQKCVEHFLNSEPMMSIEQAYGLEQSLLNQIDLPTVNMMAQSLISDTDTNLVVILLAQEKDGATYITTDQMRQAIAEVRAEQIQPFVDNVKDEPLLVMKNPKSLKTKSTSIDTDFGTKTIILQNGAKIVLKQTDFKDDEILFLASRLGGTSNFDAKDYRRFRYADDVANSNGLGNFSSIELQKALQGKQCNVNVNIDNTTEELRGHSTPQDIETMLQMAYLYLMQPGTDRKSFETYKNQMLINVANRKANPSSTLSDTATYTLFNNSPRANTYTEEDVKAMDFDALMASYKQRLANPASMTYFFIGNFDEKTLLPLIIKYIGALPKVSGTSSLRKNMMPWAKGTGVVRFEKEMQTPQSLVIDYIYKETDFTLRNKAVAELSAEVLKTLFFNEIREEKSIAYSAGCYSDFSPSENPGKADDILIFQCPVKPEYADLANRTMYQIARNVADKGFDIQELEKAREYFLKHHEEVVKTNNYWEW